tara:strand:- start:1512 stop:3263 length:1752 start_codon:yes stop_codon:yes gene_type:complete
MIKKFFLIVFLISFQLQAFSQWKSHYPEVKNEKNQKKSNSISDKNKQLFDFHLFNGFKSKALEDYESALKHFFKAIKINNLSPVPHYEIALIYNSNENYLLAIEQIEKAIKLDKDNIWYLQLYAQTLFNISDFNKAAIEYRKLIIKQPTNDELYFKLADLYIYSNDFKKAIKVYNELEGVIGISKMLSMQKHKLYREINDLKGAILELQNLLSLFPDDIEVMEILSELYLLNDEKDKAFKLFQLLSKISPNNGRIHLTLADYYRENGNNKKSYDELKLAFKSPNLSIDTKVSILISYYQLLAINDEINSQAYELADILIKYHPDDLKARAVFADILYTDNNYEKAKEQYLLILETEKSKSQLWGQALFIQAELSDFEGMLITSSEALEYFPLDPLFYYFNGLANKWFKNYNASIESFNLGLQFIIDNEDLLVEFYSSLADIYHTLKEHKLSDTFYEKALSIKPNNAIVLNNYAYYLSLRKVNLEKAKEMSLLSNNIDSTNSTYQDTYAWVLYSLNDFEGALKWILKSLKNGSDSSAVVVEHYGDILFKTGKINEAYEQWVKASQIGEGSTLLRKKIENKNLYE